MHDDHQEQAQRVNDDMPFAAHHFFSAVKAPFAARFRGLDGLTINDARARFGIIPRRRP